MLPQPCLSNYICHSSPRNNSNIFDCQNQNFSTLPATVLQDTNWLVMSGNNLGSLNKAPDYLKNTTLLNLSSSNINTIEEVVMEVIILTVKSLDISKNNLGYLPKSIAKANKTAQLWISDNPYECNCDMIWMKDWLVDAQNVIDMKNVTCLSKKGDMT